MLVQIWREEEKGETGGGRVGEEEGNGKMREGRYKRGRRERGERRGEKERINIKEDGG